MYMFSTYLLLRTSQNIGRRQKTWKQYSNFIQHKPQEPNSLKIFITFIVSKEQIPEQSCEIFGVTGETSVVQGCGFFAFLVV